MKKTAILLALCALVSACHHHGVKHVHDHEEVSEAHHHEDGGIEISPERQEKLGILVEPVCREAFSQVIRTSGQIESSAGDEMTIVAKADGIVRLGHLNEGSAVGKGSRIAIISTKEIGSGDVLAKAAITLETARKEYERDRQLSQENIVSESHLDQSRLAYEHARAAYEALVSGGAEEDGLVVSSPLSGYIKNLLVKSGDYVQTGTPLATVAGNRRLRLRADVPEKYYSLLAQVRNAEFTPSYGGRTYRLSELNGRLVSYGRASDGDCFIPVIFEFDNKGTFISGSFVEVFLKTATSSPAITVPIEAVVEDQGVRYVFVREEDDDDCFEKREVRIGQSDGLRVPVLDGLCEGEKVVVSGAVHVKLAGVSAVPAGHTHSH